jgi:Tfp pilus assembly protein PilX
MVLIMLTLIGLSAANVGVLQERMASNVSETNIAFQRAEATLRDVERRLFEVATQGTTGGLEQIPNWPDVQAIGIRRGDCSLSDGSSGGNLPETWAELSSAGHWHNSLLANDTAYAVLQLTGDVDSSGGVAGVPCRPITQTGTAGTGGNPGGAFVGYLVLARAPATLADDERPDVVLQSIVYY